MAKLKKYLTEVVYVNGADEFKSYRTYSKKVVVDTTTLSITAELDHKEIDKDSISVHIENRYDIPVYYKNVNNDIDNKITIYLDTNITFNKDDIVRINYTALNESSSDLYSIDYDNGILYLASPTNVPLDIEYKFFNTLVKAKKANQLNEDEYRVETDYTEIFNYDNTSSHKLVYNYKDETSSDYTTPVIRNLRINYINTSEEETFL